MGAGIHETFDVASAGRRVTLNVRDDGGAATLQKLGLYTQDPSTHVSNWGSATTALIGQNFTLWHTVNTTNSTIALCTTPELDFQITEAKIICQATQAGNAGLYTLKNGTTAITDTINTNATGVADANLRFTTINTAAARVNAADTLNWTCVSNAAIPLTVVITAFRVA